jgi:hypothetical protein
MHSSIDVENVPGQRMQVVNRPEPKLPDLVPRPPFDPAPPNSPGVLPQDYCAAPASGGPRADAIRLIVRNQGEGPAGPSVTRVEFSPSTQIMPIVATLTQGAPALAPGASITQDFDIPERCYPGGGSGCAFRITVDGGMPPTVTESNEANNVAIEGCPGIVP